MFEHYGVEIVIYGVRPAWLKFWDDAVFIGYEGGILNGAQLERGDYSNVRAIRLKKEHPFYTATERGFTYWPGGESAPDDRDGAEVLLRSGETVPEARWLPWRHLSSPCDIIGYRRKAEPAEAPANTGAEPPADAILLLAAAGKHIADRADTYDKPQGERSVAQTVAAFNAIHGTALTEAQGWHFLQLLKDVRAFTAPGAHRDSIEDCIAYAALKGEAMFREAGE